MSARDVGTELDRRVAAALKATAGSTGPLGGTVNRVNSTHKALKAQLASGELIDEESRGQRLLEHTRQLRRPHCGGRFNRRHQWPLNKTRNA